MSAELKALFQLDETIQGLHWDLLVPGSDLSPFQWFRRLRRFLLYRRLDRRTRSFTHDTALLQKPLDDYLPDNCLTALFQPGRLGRRFDSCQLIYTANLLRSQSRNLPRSYDACRFWDEFLYAADRTTHRFGDTWSRYDKPH